MLELLAEGLRNREIAERLVIGEATVKTHVRHVLEKLRFRNRAEGARRIRGPAILHSLPPSQVTAAARSACVIRARASAGSMPSVAAISGDRVAREAGERDDLALGRRHAGERGVRGGAHRAQRRRGRPACACQRARAPPPPSPAA